MTQTRNKCCCCITNGCGVIIVGLCELIYLLVTLAFTSHGFYIVYVQKTPVVYDDDLTLFIETWGRALLIPIPWFMSIAFLMAACYRESPSARQCLFTMFIIETVFAILIPGAAIVWFSYKIEEKKNDQAEIECEGEFKCWDKYTGYYVTIIVITCYMVFVFIPIKWCSCVCIRGYYLELKENEHEFVTEVKPFQNITPEPPEQYIPTQNPKRYRHNSVSRKKEIGNPEELIKAKQKEEE